MLLAAPTPTQAAHQYKKGLQTTWALQGIPNIVSRVTCQKAYGKGNYSCIVDFTGIVGTENGCARVRIHWIGHQEYLPLTVKACQAAPSGSTA